MSAQSRDLAERVRAWIADDPDPGARAELTALAGRGLGPDPDADAARELADRFAGPLTFGTAGLRGPLRAGPNGMNRAVVARTTAGLVGYLDAEGLPGPVVVGYDARHGSATFAVDVAEVARGAGRDALLLPGPLPTPVLAYSVNHYSAAAGVMVTASHNPGTDNGYKVYLGGGRPAAQLVAPADTDIQRHICGVGAVRHLPRNRGFTRLDGDIVDSYVDRVAGLVHIGAADPLRVVSTALHGVGGRTLRAVFARAGLPAPTPVAEQDAPDPDFPTVAFPNPEEPGAMDRLLELAERSSADLAIATDPDADRCAVAVPDRTGSWRVLTGDEVGALLADHLIRRGRTGTFATTVVSAGMLRRICSATGRPYAETLTGFKWIARADEVTGVPLGYGYEEALGYCVAPEIVRDKDGISAALVVTELATALAAHGRTIPDRLDELTAAYGVHATRQVSFRATDTARIPAAMRAVRADPPVRLLDVPLAAVEDLAPAADVLILRGPDFRVVIRPSGTEPKLKCYLEVTMTGPDSPRTDQSGTTAVEVDAARSAAESRLDRLAAEVTPLFSELQGG